MISFLVYINTSCRDGVRQPPSSPQHLAMTDQYLYAEHLTEEDEQKLIQRLYYNAIESKKETLQALDRRYYPTAEPKKITEEELRRSVNRQVDQEMALRLQRAQASYAAVYTRPSNGTAGLKTVTKPLSSEDVEQSVERQYTDALERKKANMDESNRRYLHHAAPTKTMPKSVIQESINRLSQPKKTEFTILEINKIYGLGGGS